MKKTEGADPKPVKKIIIASIIALVVVAGYVGMFYFYRQYRQASSNPNQATIKETEALVAELGNLMQLPGDETPTLATVLDKSKLKDQPFFKNAENGDKLLAYTKSMKAILYRPSTKKIVEVAPIVIQNTANGGTTQQPANNQATPDNKAEEKAQ